MARNAVKDTMMTWDSGCLILSWRSREKAFRCETTKPALIKVLDERVKSFPMCFRAINSPTSRRTFLIQLEAHDSTLPSKARAPLTLERAHEVLTPPMSDRRAVTWALVEIADGKLDETGAQ